MYKCVYILYREIEIIQSTPELYGIWYVGLPENVGKYQIHANQPKFNLCPWESLQNEVFGKNGERVEVVVEVSKRKCKEII